MEIENSFNPPAWRFTVRTPETRYTAIREAANRVGMEPGQLVQALFDTLDLSRVEGDIARAATRFEALYPKIEKDTRLLAERAASVGMTVRELRVFRALVNCAGMVRIVRPGSFDIAAKSGVAASYLDETYDALLTKGFIALAPSQGRGRRAYVIARMPDL
ncbi:MAG: hypothetical protein LCH86_07595 [Proteobacteria bacterium]|nr:hypothetical protein [Pseudomonadota bacterium]